jgi:hypothetical protein
LENLKRCGHLENLGIDGRIILKLISLVFEGGDWIFLAYGVHLAWFHKCCKYPPKFIQAENFFDQSEFLLASEIGIFCMKSFISLTV